MGFTIVELLVVIVVIGALAAITIISYTGITSKATASALQSDLANAKQQLSLYQILYDSYPTAMTNNCPTAPVNDTNYCIKASSGSSINLSTNTTGSSYILTANNDTKTVAYSITESTSPTVSVPIDDNWIAIGSQVWAKANLNVGTMVTGITEQTDNSVVEKYCPNNLESNCTTYGALYQWNEAMQYSTTEGAQGICPTGSHIPTDNDWKILEMQLGMTQEQADATLWRGTDQGTQMKIGGSSGLNVPFAGGLYSDSFLYLSSYTILWSSSESGTSAQRRLLHPGYATIQRTAYPKAYGFSVRCLGN